MVLGEVIHPDRARAIPGRKITESPVLIRDSVCHARDRNPGLVLLNFDVEKAFDGVSQQHLFRLLRNRGFPERMFLWVINGRRVDWVMCM